MIRMAAEADLPAIVRLCLEGIKEFDFEYANMAVPDEVQIAKYVYKQWLTAPAFILELDNKIVGFWGLKLDSHWWSRDIVLMDYRMYISPCYRNINNVKSLYEAGQSFAVTNGLPLHCGMLTTDGRLDARRRLMRRLGFKETGFTFAFGG